MRQLLPISAAMDATVDVDPVAAYAMDVRVGPAGRPWVVVNMIASLDGATAVEGKSGALGGPGDKRVFAALRAIVDVILVAAGTVRAENYGPPRPSQVIRAQRRARGQSEAPRVAIVTRTLDLDVDMPLFTEAEQQPYVIVPEASDPTRRAAVARQAKVVVCGEHDVALPEALGELHADGARTVLVEGGPSINGTMVAGDLVDELCLTMAPMLISGSSSRIAHAERSVTTGLHLRRILEEDGMLFLRYSR